MGNGKAHAIILVGLVAVAALGWASWVGIRDISERIEGIMEDAGQVLRATWKSGGVQQELETTRQAEESDADFVARHKATLKVALEEFPPDDG